MLSGGNNTFAASIPPIKKVDSLDYYITAQDMAGNTMSSEKMEMSIGDEVCLAIWVVLGIVLSVLVIGGAIKIRVRIRRKKFIQGGGSN